MKQSYLEFGNSLVNFLRIKSIIKPLYYRFYKSKQIEKLKGVFIDNAKEALLQFDTCMRNNGIPYTLAFGTMLGAVREHGFIKHDFDIDTMMWNEDYFADMPNILYAYGFKRTHTFLVDAGALGREETYEYKGVHIDIFFMYPAINELPYCCDFLRRDCLTYNACMKKYGSVLPRRLELPVKREVKHVPFEDLLLPIPVNAEEILAFRYGQDYMIPNPKWDVQSYNEHIIEWNEKDGTYVKLG